MKLIVLGVLGLFLCFSASTAEAATIYANSATGNDTTGDGTLGSPYKTFHKAYTAASSTDTINLTGTFSWTDADETGDTSTTGYTLSKTLTIVGQGADETIIQAATTSSSGDRRVFTIPNTASTTLQDVQIRYGRQTSTYGGCLYAGTGGAGVSLTLIGVDINNCTANASGSGGGALMIYGYQQFSVRNSSVRNNIGNTYGGAFYLYNPTGSGYNNAAYITNTTFSGNQNTAGSAIGGAIVTEYDYVTLYITNSTFLNNVSNYGTVTAYRSSTISFKNTIVASSTAVSGGAANAPVYYGFSGVLTSAGANIFGYYTTNITKTTGDWMPVNTSTSVLTLNGGSATGTLSIASTTALNEHSTHTHALLEDSAAVDNGVTSAHGGLSIPTTDQRGFARSGDTDIGAYEYGGTADGGGGDDVSSGGQTRQLVAPPEPALTIGKVSETTAMVFGTYTAPGVYTDNIGIEYWKNDEAKSVEKVVLQGNISGFMQVLRELLCDTKYSVRVYAKNAVATTHSDTATFNTKSCATSTDEQTDTNEALDEVSDESELATLQALIEKARQMLQSLFGNNSADTQNTPQVATTQVPTEDLKYGDEGAAVEALQQLIIDAAAGPSAAELARVGITGYFGTYTENALSEYQQVQGILPPNGFYGSLTRQHLQTN